MQCLHDESRAAFNALVDELTDSGAASQIGAAAPRGFGGSTVQAVLNELAAAIGELGGSFEVEGSALAELVAAAIRREMLSEYYTAAKVEEKMEALGIAMLTQRMNDMENALSADGIVAGEVTAAYPFTLPAAELAGAAELIGDKPAVWTNGELVTVAASEIVRVQPSEGEIKRLPLRGDIIPAAAAFEPVWSEGGYLIGQAAGVWYLVSVKTGACALLSSAEGSAFCGAARVGNIVTAVFCRDGSLHFLRRSIAGDSGSQPALTALDAYTESGSTYDRVLNVWGGVFVMLKYRDAGSVLKIYEPSEMACSAEYAAGSACRARSIRPAGEDCFFVIETDGASHPARCRLGTSSVPVLTVGAGSAEHIIAATGSYVFAVDGSDAVCMDKASLATLESIALPADVPTPMDGAPLGEPWGGKYVLVGSRLLNIETMKFTALRCEGAKPEKFAILPAAERCFAACANGSWYVFDSLLRPVWGTVPYVRVVQKNESAAPAVDTSAFGAMNKA